DAARGNVILRQHVRLFPGRQDGRLLQVAQELPGDFAEVRLVAHAEALGNPHGQAVAVILDGNTGIDRSQTGNARRDGPPTVRPVLRIVGHNVQLRPIVLFFALAYFHARPAAAKHGQVRVAATGRLVIPQDIELHVHAAERVGYEVVAVVMQPTAL